MGWTLYFLFLQFQLSLHVRECSFNLLEVLVRFCVYGIDIFMLPVLLSVGVSWTRDQVGEVATFWRNHSRRHTLQLPFHCLRLRVFTHKFTELGVVDIQTGECSQLDKPGE